ncbi:hypothetical protein NDU88_002971 [Pleurodeles waltl]|uniref:Uncharacterized protein n=1 Tax=Pleurodeles waltl TaxID=8319 RepID=A0AAV7PGV6_PLEWA|nr:hypothetical protein NDU88_002971 [Pleurodeles waltl]
MERNQLTRVVGVTRWPGHMGVKAPQDPWPRGSEAKTRIGASVQGPARALARGPAEAPELKPEGKPLQARQTPSPGLLGVRQARGRERLT